MRRLLAVIVAGAAPLAAAGAQGCTYDRCALRREGVFFSQRIVAGVEGRVAARQGFGGFRLDSALAGSERALTEARVHRRESRRGGALMLAGSVLGAVALADAVRTEGDLSDARTGVLLGGAALSLAGGWRLQIADRALARAIWWHNRDLPR
jgi:hypothetical protein